MKPTFRVLLVAVCLCTHMYIAVEEQRAGAVQKAYDNSQSQDIPSVVRGNPEEATSKQKQKSEEERFRVKEERAKNLVHRAVEYFNNHTISQASRIFAEDDTWQDGEMHVFIIDEHGTVYSHGQDNDLIWRNINEVRKERQKEDPVKLHDDLVVAMQQAAKKDGWLEYEWNFELKRTYVSEVTRYGMRFYIGTGFYPESHRLLVQNLVNKAVEYTKEYSVSSVTRRIINPAGNFVIGPLFLWMYDFEGNTYAHGNDIGWIGQNRMDWQDDQGKYVNRVIIEKLQQQESAWVDYHVNGNVLKRAYVRRYKDPDTGKRYVIGGGYYPDVDVQMMKSFVHSAIDHLKTNTPEDAFVNFNTSFKKGPMRIYVFSIDGVVLANGEFPTLVGEKLLETEDPEGYSVYRDIIETAKQSGEGRVTTYQQGGYKELYFKRVELPDGTYIVGSGFWPDSKATVAEALTNRAAIHMKNNDLQTALQDFTQWNSRYMRGDLFVEVVDFDGIVMVFGPRTSYIWDSLDIRTARGYKVSSLLIETARTGGGWVSYEALDNLYHMYVQQVSKPINPDDESHGTRNFAVGVFYFG